MVIIILCTILIWYIIHNTKKVARVVADKTARLMIDKFFVYRRMGWTYIKESSISNEEMQDIIEEVKDGGSKF